MVTFTLKLGISILNGGNILVQQVEIGRHTICTILSLIFTFMNFCLVENAGLSEGKERRRLFQKFVWTHDVLQVIVLAVITCDVFLGSRGNPVVSSAHTVKTVM